MVELLMCKLLDRSFPSHNITVTCPFRMPQKLLAKPFATKTDQISNSKGMRVIPSMSFLHGQFWASFSTTLR